MFKYPLQTYDFTLWDRLKVAAFALNKRNRLTSGPQVIKLEQEWSKISGMNCIFTSSGSTANSLLFEVFLQTNNLDPRDVVVFCPSTTWASSVTPIIMRGMSVVFVDINLQDFSFNHHALDQEMSKKEYADKKKVIWPTALIGFIPDVGILRGLSKKHNAYLFADLCECSMGAYQGQNILSCFDMATTSSFFAHQTVSIEGGVLFIKPSLKQEYHNALSIRSHGLTRVLPESVKNEINARHPEIDKEFLFTKIGTNWRNSDIHAFYGLLDIKRFEENKNQRENIWYYFLDRLPDHFMNLNGYITPFCLPFVLKKNNPAYLKIAKSMLNSNGWETRPIICYLPANPAFQKYKVGEYPNSKYLNDNGFYVGLNRRLREKDIDNLMEILQ